jgi:hypothetical protein
MSNKHIKKYLQFIFEQDLGAGMPPMGAPQPGEAGPKKEVKYKVIFIDDDDKGVKKYPDGSASNNYQTYEATEQDVKKWATDNINPNKEIKLTESALEIKRQMLIDLVKGKRSNFPPADEKFVAMLKNALSTGIFGSKGPKLTVFFSPKKDIMTDDIETSFIMMKSIHD